MTEPQSHQFCFHSFQIRWPREGGPAEAGPVADRYGLSSSLTQVKFLHARRHQHRQTIQKCLTLLDLTDLIRLEYRIRNVYVWEGHRQGKTGGSPKRGRQI
jgi:hypothetical protein